VNIVIELPPNLYDGFVDKCDPSSREYELLKNGIIVRRPKGEHYERLIEINCKIEQGKRLLDLARQICPLAVPH
jgi:hypothetical protein